MKFVALTALVASVSAQTGVTCTNPGSGWTEVTGAGTAYENVTDHAGCKSAADGASLDATTDHCLASINQDDDTANGGAAASYSCILYTADSTGADDIREAATDTDTLTHEAWAWVAGTESADWVDSSATVDEEDTTDEGDEEDDEEALSVKMTASAIAAATVAMMAF